MLRRLFGLSITILLLPGCTDGANYLRLARPSVLTELTPPVVRLVNEIPALDQPNELTVAKLYALGGLSHAEEGEDGVMRVEMMARASEFIWQPAIIVMPHAGELELEIANPGEHFHMALMPSNGARQILELPPGTAGRMRLQLDGPGWYWFFCPVENHFGRGMFGYILVAGEVPPAVQLDRPPQPLPRDRPLF